MIVLGILASFAAIAGLCWLVFNLAVFALPFLVGLHTGIWAYGTGTGWLGAILVGGFAAGLTLAIGQALIILVRPLWARFVIALIFVVINLVVDLLYFVVDPRLRVGKAGGH